MPKSFKHKGLEKLYRTGNTRGIQTQHVRKLRLQMAALDSAKTIRDVDIPGYRLHQLKGDRRDMRVRFIDGNAYIVNYEDYH